MASGHLLLSLRRSTCEADPKIDNMISERSGSSVTTYSRDGAPVRAGGDRAREVRREIQYDPQPPV
jgi:hypothetical protein